MKSMLLGLILLGSSMVAKAESLSEYAQTCDKYVGGTVNSFNCLDGAEIPIDGPDSGPCANPSHLNGKCHKYSRLGKLESGNSEVEVRFLCRHYSQASGINDGIFNDIAVIQRNTRTGATCFYQSPTGGNLDGTRVTAPSRGDLTIWGPPEQYTAGNSCVSCHDNGSGFIKTPFLKAVQGYHSIPTPPKEMRAYYFPGKVMDGVNVYSVKSKSAPICSSCHGIGSGSGGSAQSLGRRSAGLDPIDNQSGSFLSWMPFDQNSARAHNNCANDHNNPDCIIRQFETGPRGDGLSEVPLRWTEISSTDIHVRAGDSLPRSVYQAAGSGSVAYEHGHPQDECSWDNPHQEGNQMVLTGTTPRDGTYSLSGQTLVAGDNVCNILLIARSGSEQIQLTVRVTITKENANNGPQLGGIYNLVSRRSGKCLDASEHSVDNGIRFQQWDCTGEQHQKFRLQDGGNGMFNLVAVHSNRCVSSEASKPDNGVAIIQWDCNGGSDQKVALSPSADGSYTVRFQSSFKCMDVPAGSLDNGTKIQQWDCDAGNANQNWFFRLN